MNSEPDRASVERGLADVEGYLLLHGEVDAARADAERFAADLDWLTAAQRDEVIQAYTRDRLTVTRNYLQRTARTAQRLRGEYQARYDQLRACLLLVSLSGYAVAAVVVLLLVLP